MQQIYTGRDGQKYGPYTRDEVISMIQAGQIIATDSAWYEGLPEWYPITTFPDFAPYFPPPPTTPSIPNPALTTRLGRKLQRHRQPQPASRGLRLLAKLVDGFILMAPWVVLGIMNPEFFDMPENVEMDEPRPMPPGSGYAGAAFLLVGLIQILLLSLRGQTIGKAICAIKIVRTDFSPAGFVRAFLIRAFCNNLLFNIPFIGWLYLIVDTCFIFRSDRRCIHDLMADTVVVKC